MGSACFVVMRTFARGPIDVRNKHEQRLMEAPYSPERREWSMTRYDQDRSSIPVDVEKKRRTNVQPLIGACMLGPGTGWVDRIDAGDKPGLTTTEREEIKALRKELAELKAGRMRS